MKWPPQGILKTIWQLNLAQTMSFWWTWTDKTEWVEKQPNDKIKIYDINEAVQMSRMQCLEWMHSAYSQPGEFSTVVVWREQMSIPCAHCWICVPGKAEQSWELGGSPKMPISHMLHSKLKNKGMY